MTTAAPTSVIEYDFVLSSLKKYEADTSFETNDIQQAEYKRDSEFGSLNWSNDKYELNEWAARQLCRVTHVPFGAFRKASEKLASDMFKEFVPSVKDPQIKLAVKTRGSSKTLRGILPIDYPDLRNSEILESMQSYQEPFHVEAAPWLDQANPSMLRTRVVFDRISTKVKDDDLNIGLDITISELGNGPFQINVLLFKQSCSNGAIVTYAKRPYFYYDYSGTFAFHTQDLFAAALNRAMSDITPIINVVEKAQNTSCTVEQANRTVQAMSDKQLLNKGIAMKVLGSVEKEGCKTQWDLVNHITAQARGFRDELRLRYERAGGLLLGLAFDRNATEQEYATSAPELRDDVTAQLLLAN